MEKLLNKEKVSLYLNLKCQKKPRGIYCAKYYGQRGWKKKMVPGKKIKNEAVRNKRKKKEKGERKKKKRKRGRVIFLLIYGTLLLIIVFQRNIS